MFVRFRQARRLQVSLIETHRVAGEVRHDHVASLGAVDAQPTVADRVMFLQGVHERLSKLSNRIDTATQGKILGDAHARIPMVTIEELRALQLDNAAADKRFWAHLDDMNREFAEGNKQLTASAERAATKADTEAEKTRAKAEAAKDRVARIKRDEGVPGGLGRPPSREDFEAVLRDAGWTAADIERAVMVHTIGELGGFHSSSTCCARTPRMDGSRRPSRFRRSSSDPRQPAR
jgi:hypothetical protein